MNHKITSIILSLILCLSLHAEDDVMEFNLGFYYDIDAARNVKRLGGMEMHAHICASQFNQALISAGIDNVWVNPAMIASLDYNAEGDSIDALMRQIIVDAPQTIADMEEFELDFAIVFVCLQHRDESATTLGVTIGFYRRPGIFDADDDHEAEWAEELQGSDIEGVYFDIIKTPVPGQPGKVRLSYAYRVLAMDLYEALNSYTFTHELGHIFGAGHSRDQNEQRGPANEDVTPFAGGSYLTIKEGGEKHHYCSVMSYNDAGYTDSGIQYIQLPMFTSLYPQRIGTHGEFIIGSEEDDNARAIVENATILSQSRPYGVKDTQSDEIVGEYVEYDPSATDKQPPPLPTFSKWSPEYIAQ